MPIMMRSAEDDFAALKTADAMEKAGATVITLTPNGQAQYPAAMVQSDMTTPDFGRIARACLDAADSGAPGGGILESLAEAEIAEQLRLMWNARGAADIAKAEHVLSEKGNAAPMVWLDPALRGLDQ